jgi:hypothetical protein
MSDTNINSNNSKGSNDSKLGNKITNALLSAKPIIQKIFIVFVLIFLIFRLWKHKGIILLDFPVTNGQNPNYLSKTNPRVNTSITPTNEGIPLPYKINCSWWIYLTSPSKWFNVFNEKAKNLDTLSINLEFTYLIWIKVFNIPGNESWNEDYTLPKILLNRNYAPIILYIPATNRLRVGMQTNNEDQLTFYEIPDFFRLQTWQCLGVGLQDRYLDIYLNGELNRSFVLPGVPYLNTSTIYLFPNYGFFAQVSLILYFMSSLNPDQMKQYYLMNNNSKIPYNKHFYFNI